MTDVSQRPGAEQRVYHFLTSFCALNELSPDVTFPRVIERGEGAYLVEEGGRRLLDAGHHLGACAIGHGRAEIGARMAEQAATLEYASLEGGLTHRPVAELAERLAAILPMDDPLLHFCSTGSEANEAALKLARGYHANRGKPTKTKILARAGGYHGSSYGALTASGNPVLREPYAPGIADVVRTSQPSPGRCGYCTLEMGCNLGCASDIERTIVQEGADTVAAVIAEPVSVHQAVKIPDDGYWPRLREICDRYDVLLIADEVVTGFGRIGPMFGVERWGVRPDIMTLAKAVTSGYIPLGAAAASRRVADAFAERPFIHINTYAGHPVACAAALATLDVYEAEGIIDHVLAMEPVVVEEASALRARTGVVRTAAIGMVATAEFAVADAASGMEAAKRLRFACYQRGVLVRTAADALFGAVWFMPPLTLDEDEIRGALRSIGEALDEVLGGSEPTERTM